jgi:hypothetical protein
MPYMGVYTKIISLKVGSVSTFTFPYRVVNREHFTKRHFLQGCVDRESFVEAM